MQLIYCHIQRFRNIENQEINFSDTYRARFDGIDLTIDRCARNIAKDYLYGNNFMRHLHVIVGKTGSGKTNLLQMLGMDKWSRMDRENAGAYLMLYKAAADNEFVIETVGLDLPVFANVDNMDWFGSSHKIRAFKFTYDFDHHQFQNIRYLQYDEMESTHIINAFDQYSFAHYPYSDEHTNEWHSENGLLPRMIVRYGKSSITMDCLYLQDYLQNLQEDNIKRNASLTIRWDNWQHKIPIDLDEELLKSDYWTYHSRAEEQRMNNLGKKQHDRHYQHPKSSTPKSRFIHDLMVDFAIYLRKHADSFIEEYPAVLPDGQKMSVLKRIDALCQYLDYHLDEWHGAHGMIWQEGSDITDIFHILAKMDNKYFSDDEFSIPIIDIDLSEGSPMSELFERMDQYRADEDGVFTEQLLPYHWTCISSGEYQYAKIWGILEAYAVKIKVTSQGESFENAKSPNIILLLDEPESYMHPEMCRCFIHKMNEILSRRFKDTDFQVILSTHSPFMLSDVLSEQVIRIDYDEVGKCHISQHTDKPYFAANIHSIMADGFFLNYTIGEQARLFLTDKLGLLRAMADHRDKLTQEELEEVQAMHNFIGNIGDDLIRMSFENLLQQLT